MAGDGPYAICGTCNARVPYVLLVDHLAEHGFGTREEILAAIVAATITDRTGESDDADAEP